MSLLRSFALLSALLFAAPAAAADLVSRLVDTDAALDYLAGRDALVLDASVSDVALQDLAEHPDWRVRQQAASVLGWRQQTALFTQVMQATPVLDRAQRLRFPTAPLSQPEAFPAIVERYLHAGEGVAVRAGLYRSLVGLDARWTEVARGLFAEAEPEIRIEILVSVRKAQDPSVVLDTIRRGLMDGDAAVRAAAAVSAGWRADGADLAPELLANLKDVDEAPRAMAARALGWLGVASATSALPELLGDSSGEVRLHALRSLRRIDAGQAKALPQLPALAADVDPRVANVAKKLIEQR